MKRYFGNSKRDEILNSKHMRPIHRWTLGALPRFCIGSGLSSRGIAKSRSDLCSSFI